MVIPPRVWKLMLGVGAVVWIVAAVVTEATNDDILVPTVIIVGSFIAPRQWRRSRSRGTAMGI